MISYTLDSDDWDDGEQELTISGYTVTNKTKIDVDISSTIADTLYSRGCIGIYVENDKAIYRDVGEQGNEDKATVKIARDVENCVFSEEIQNGKSKITVDLTIGSKQQTYTYTVNN